MAARSTLGVGGGVVPGNSVSPEPGLSNASITLSITSELVPKSVTNLSAGVWG